MTSSSGRRSTSIGTLAWLALAGSVSAMPVSPPPDSDAANPALPLAAALGDAADAAGWDELCLRRAIALWTSGDVPAALDALAARDSATGTDRADFLARFGARLTQDPRAWRPLAPASPWSRWNSSLEQLDLGDVRSALGHANVEVSDVWRDALEVHDRNRLGADRGEALRRLARRSAGSDAERDLVANAWWQLGVDVARAGGDPNELFGRIPSGSDRHAHARWIEWLSDPESDAVNTAALGPAERRAAQQALAIRDLRAGRWESAHLGLTEAEGDWRRELNTLDALLADERSLENLWTAWSEPAQGSLVVDAAPFESASAQRVAEALDLRIAEPRPGNMKFPLRVAGPGRNAGVPRPDAAARERVAELERTWAGARAAVTRHERAASLASRDMARHGRYLDTGSDRVAAELATTDSLLVRIEELLARTDAIVATLDAVRDAELLRIAQRTASFLETAQRQRVVVLALRRFHAGSPGRDRVLFPAGVPSPEEVLAAENGLSGDLESWFETFARHAAENTRRSHAEIWIPRATDGTQALAANANARRAHELQLVAGIDSTRAHVTHPDRLTPYRDAVLAALDSAARAESAWHAERQRVAREQVLAQRDRLRGEGEGLLYATSIATNEWAVSRLASAMTDSEKRNARGLLEDAANHWQSFLLEYPQAPARSEARYRLADVRLHEAREDFRVAMHDFLGRQGDAPVQGGNDRALAPFVDYTPALEIYRSLLIDDPSFAHRDAVLFHVGMILSDEGNPEARAQLTELVTDFPASRYAQEAFLRLADDRFGAKDFAGSVRDYESAAAGSNPDHAAIALYKLGWAHYNLDQFRESARSFRRLLDVYGADPEATGGTDLRDEARDHLVHALARAGGAPAFASLFDETGGRPYERGVLTDLGRVLRRFSLFDEAVAADELWLERYPEHPDALAAGQRLVATLEARENPERANAARLELVDHFRRDSAWSRAVDSDSLKTAGDEWALASVRKVALFHHRNARQADDAAAAVPTSSADWQRALDLYETQLHGWPKHASGPHAHFYAGEAAAALGSPLRAIQHFEQAAGSDTASFRIDAAWQAVTVRDSWYERERLAGAAATAGPDSLARELLAAVDRFTEKHGTDERSADLLWRQGNVARSHEWPEEAAAAFQQLVRDWPMDARRPVAARLRSESLYATAEANPKQSVFPQAAEAFDLAARLAREAGDDSTATTLNTMVPHCHEREADRVALAHGGDHRKSAELFERLADQWPSYEHSHRALYRAGLGYDADGDVTDAVRAWTGLSQRYPESEYARDSRLNVAKAWERSERPAAAARAYRDFATDFPADADAGSALMLAADLFLAAGDVVSSEVAQTSYLERFPDDVETAVEILETRATRELDSVGPGEPVSALLALAGDGAASPSHLARYIELTNARPDLAAPKLLARVRFLRGEEARTAYERTRITLPLAPSVAQKKSLLENVLEEYRNAAAYEIAPWNRASAVRIGECLVAFGDALMESERPADLTEDDLYAYEEVLEEQSWQFFDRGEEAWAELVRQTGAATAEDVDDEWVHAARRQLWPRVATRFLHRPEVVYPLIAAEDRQPDEAP